jgi:adenylate cyclase
MESEPAARIASDGRDRCCTAASVARDAQLTAPLGVSMKTARLHDLIHLEPKRGLQFPGWIERLVSIGIVSTDAQIVRRQRCVNVAALATAANAIGHLVVNSIHNFRGLMVVNVYNVLVIAASLLIPRLHCFGEHAGAIALLLMITLGHTFVVWSFGLSSELHVYFTLAGTMLFFFGVQNWRLFLLFFSLWLLALVAALGFAPVKGLMLPEDENFREMLSSQAMINMIFINAAMLFYALAALQQSEVDLQNQYERSEALIEIVMPRSIAQRLKSGREEHISDRIETLSVMFLDLVGFTSATRDLSPDQVVGFLDRLVRSFDALCEAHGVDKIKTIGDSYMAAAGFDGRAPEGAVAVGRLALIMIDALDRQMSLGGRKLEARIGIHCGPAMAGIIGDTRFSYDVWGDAVNVASRMESHGVPGRIQVSERYRNLTQEIFRFEERAGLTDFKGVGLTRTFFLVGEIAPV